MNKKINLHFLFFLFLSFSFLQSCNPDSDLDDPQNLTPTMTYNIGDIGPADGIVFYDKGSYSDGWRYIEAAPSDLETSEWGCFDNSVPEAQFSEIGTGLSNSEAIVAFHNSFTNYYNNPNECSDNSNGTVAAKVCLDLELNGADNWHLPSEDEMIAMYENLQLNSLGDFSQNLLYWTSTEVNNNGAWAKDFENGEQGVLCKQCDGVVIIRAVRYF